MSIPDPTLLSCPVPVHGYPRVTMGHGGGGRLSGELLREVFLPAFTAHRGDAAHPLLELGDSATLPTHAWVPGSQLALATDAFVVRPRFFPGGNIGHLAVHGTVNDLACSGAIPTHLTVACVLEEGMPLEELRTIATTMGEAAHACQVQIVAGDTKVVEAGHGDGVYLVTSGVGVVPPGVRLSPAAVQPGDAVLLSGPIGAHGIAVLSVRDGLEFGVDCVSDTAPIHHLTRCLLDAQLTVRTFRDPTRGGVAATLHEIGTASGVGIEVDGPSIPVPEAVVAACGFLGLDPLHIANEGRVVAFVAPEDAEEALALWRSRPDGAAACRIGTATAEHPGMVVERTAMGARRVIDLPLTEQLPRIC